MSSTTSGQCKLCGEWIPYTVGDPVELGVHMMDRHSDDVGQYSVTMDESQSRNKIPCAQCCNIPGPAPVTVPCQQRKKKTMRAYKRGLYKTTLETWTTATGYVQCPGCGQRVKPLIRSQKNKVAYTSIGATFLLSCWPLCFLFPLLHKCSMDLYCPNCKYSLGIYDSATGATKINHAVPNIL